MQYTYHKHEMAVSTLRQRLKLWRVSCYQSHTAVQTVPRVSTTLNIIKQITLDIWAQYRAHCLIKHTGYTNDKYENNATNTTVLYVMTGMPNLHSLGQLAENEVRRRI